METVLQTYGLTKQYGSFTALSNLDLALERGKIIGLLGPNGSGKSNVGDAVRWVLGEQSARQLRGSNMQDVIFSGTENRKPLGFASVSITLDNADHKLPVDYEEVTVSRRVYRSGESEYRLNGTSCRLKDIQEISTTPVSEKRVTPSSARDRLKRS